MIDLIKIDDVQPLDGHWLRVTFSDGAVKDVDLGELLAAGGVFAPIAGRREIFERVRVNQETRTVEWPGDVDLDPHVLYGTFEPASGARNCRRDRARTEPGDDSGRPARRRFGRVIRTPVGEPRSSCAASCRSEGNPPGPR